MPSTSSPPTRCRPSTPSRARSCARSPPTSRASNDHRPRAQGPGAGPRAEARAGGSACSRSGPRPRAGAYWSAVNNTEVGLWYTVATFVFFLGAGVLALLMRYQLAVPNHDFLSQEAYNQVFTMHGTVMMFLVAVPFLEAVAIYFLPQMLGARDLPFPRLSAYGFWCYVIGGATVFGSIFFLAGPDGGWFMYPPLTNYRAFAGDRRRHLAARPVVRRDRHARRRGRADHRRAQDPPARHVDQPDPALRLVHPGDRRDDPVRLPAADRGRHPARVGARCSTGRSSIPSAAAIRCSGSTCSGSSATRRSTSSSCPRSAWSR